MSRAFRAPATIHLFIHSFSSISYGILCVPDTVIPCSDNLCAYGAQCLMEEMDYNQLGKLITNCDEGSKERDLGLKREARGLGGACLCSHVLEALSSV